MNKIRYENIYNFVHKWTSVIVVPRHLIIKHYLVLCNNLFFLLTSFSITFKHVSGMSNMVGAISKYISISELHISYLE